ncbi:MAG: TAT-variant-translocated molybdopterin oxidoreductase [Blastocatellia bacterium]
MSEPIRNNPLTHTPENSHTDNTYWRSLDQLADTPEFRDFLHREFPLGASEFNDSSDGMGRRRFMTLMSASMALAGLATGCRRPVQHILPAARVSDLTIAGDAQFFATIMDLGGQALGLVVRSNDGRPTKIEGNPAHPASLGGANAWAQASVLDLYDPDRSQSVRHDGKTLRVENKHNGWPEFVKFADPHFTKLRESQGTGLRILTESSSSPSLRELRDFFLKTFPQAKWHTYDAVSRDNALAGAQIATGQAAQAHYAYDRADVVLAVDSDFLGLDPQVVINTKKFSKRRQVTATKADLNRLYAVESQFSITGAMADHRQRMQSSRIGGFLAALAKELGVSGAGIDNLAGKYSGDKKFLGAVAKDLAAHKGKSIVTVGARQPAAVHALAHLINSALTNVGATITLTRAIADNAESGMASLKDLTQAMDAGQVNTLLILGGNPVYSAPADLGFGDKLKKVAARIHLGQEIDETGAACNWHINAAHYLETWGDGRAVDGTASIQQPLIEPLYDGKSALEVLAHISGYPQKKPYDIVRATWQKQIATDFEKSWARALHDGVIAGTAFPALTPAINAGNVAAELDKLAAAGGTLVAASNDIEINFMQDASLYDGRFANNAWMQEAPDPMSKLTWDNAAVMSAGTAKRLEVKNEDMIKVTYRGNDLELPVFIVPGTADNAIFIALGYGRTNVGKVGKGGEYTFPDKIGETLSSFLGANSTTFVGGGFNANKLRRSDTPDFGMGASVQKLGRTYALAATQDHWSMEGRSIVVEGTTDQYNKDPKFVSHKVEDPKRTDLYEPALKFDTGPQWGLAIDLNACTGCNACVIACQSENNIPVVGKEQVRRGREMNWIRMDRYFTGVPDIDFFSSKEPELNEDQVRAVYQPVGCQHCENAPCENVCPVAATVHSEDGLNTMAYNRCVGTRYCSNNCPYKVRRFNFANWHEDLKKPEYEVRKMAHNPEVTVRMRGVMEKCTYCIQRIQNAKIKIKVQARQQGQDWKIADGAITPACAQTCPADAIVFGDILDPNSRVSQWKNSPRDYKLLNELNIRPRTSYLAKLRNPNTELEPATAADSHGGGHDAKPAAAESNPAEHKNATH